MRLALVIAGGILFSLMASAQDTEPSAAPPSPENGPGALPAIQTWTDPRENGFSVRAPVGWPIAGGTQWTGAMDAHSVVRERSLDGQLTAFMDDPGLLPRQVPNPLYARLGWIEGRV